MLTQRSYLSVKTLLCFVLIAAAAAQEPPAASPKHPPEIEALVDRARSAPPEFAADTLIRIATAQKFTDRAWKRELLEEAFRRAAAAQHPYKKQAVAPRRDTPRGFMDRAFSQNLDARSLQSRALSELVKLDVSKARELLGEMPPLQLPALTCKEPLVYDVSGFYEMLGEIASRLRGDEPYKLLQPYVGSLQSPVQVGPVAHLLASVKFSQEHFEALLAAFAGSMKEISGDDRSFSFAISRRSRLNAQMLELLNASKGRQAGTAGLLEAYRAFLVRHLKAARCADGNDPAPAAASFGMAMPQKLSEALQPTDAVRFFNDSLRLSSMQAITEEEVQPAKVEGEAGGQRICESQECRDQVKAYNSLLFPGGTPVNNEIKGTSEWQARLKEFLASLASWTSDSGGTPLLHFQEKCQLYSDLINVVPNGPDRELVLRSFLDFLQRNSFQSEGRIEWFMPVNALLGRIFFERNTLKNVYNDLQNSGDAVISLYTALEDFAPQPQGQSLSLL